MEHVILGLMLLIQTGLLVAGLRMMVIMSREVQETLLQSQLTREALSKGLRQKTRRKKGAATARLSDTKQFHQQGKYQ